MTLLDVMLEPGVSFEEDVPADRSVLAYVIKGSVQIGSEGRTLRAMEAAGFADREGAISVRTSDEAAQVVLLTGRPLREPSVSYGPFVMNTEPQIAQAIERFRAGAMGSLAPAGKA